MRGKLILATSCAMVLLGFAAITLKSNAETAGTEYSNKMYGIYFIIPEGIRIYTADNPGPLASRISSNTPIYLVNLNFTEENCNVQVIEPISENDLTSYKNMLEQNPKMNLPKYQRISVDFIKIGKQKTITAVEHMFMMQGNIFGKLRQVTFAHNGKGFIFTCATAVDRFDKTNQQFFIPLFESMAFK